MFLQPRWIWKKNTTNANNYLFLSNNKKNTNNATIFCQTVKLWYLKQYHDTMGLHLLGSCEEWFLHRGRGWRFWKIQQYVVFWGRTWKYPVRQFFIGRFAEKFFFNFFARLMQLCCLRNHRNIQHFCSIVPYWNTLWVVIQFWIKK